MELKRAFLWLLCALLGFFYLAQPQDFPLLAGRVVRTYYRGDSCRGISTSDFVDATFGVCVPRGKGSYALFLVNWLEYQRWSSATAEPTLEPTELPSPNPSRPSRRPTRQPSVVIPALPLPRELSAQQQQHQQQPALNNLTFLTVNLTYSTHDCSGDEASTYATIYAEAPSDFLYSGSCRHGLYIDRFDQWHSFMFSYNVSSMLDLVVGKGLVSGLPISQMDALESLFLSAGGKSWNADPSLGSKWKFSKSNGKYMHDPCAELWFGILCKQVGDKAYVDWIYLSRFNLVGTIPSTISMLENLRLLDLSANILRGQIPVTLSGNSALTWLDLSQNKLSSTIPSQILKLNRLNFLSLSNNSISGQVPTAISSLSRLFYLSADSNFLTGSIPARIGDLTALTWLDFSCNSLQSTIPLAIGMSLTSLEYLSVWSNCLTGQIPSMANLKSLKVLRLADNFFSTGALPGWISTLTNLRSLRLSNTSLTGPLLPGLGYLSQLKELSLASNQLTSTVPPFAGSSLSSLDLSNNLLDGLIPYLAKHTGLQNLQLSGNSFSNTVPTSLCKLSNLQVLDVSGNALLGSPPACLSQLPALRALSLASNQLTNSGNGLDFLLAPSLQVVDVSSNNFQGPLPAAVFKSSRSLRIFAAAANCFQGTLPADAICAAKKLQVLVLDGLNSGASCRAPIFAGPANLFSFTGSVIRNKMSGSLPSCLFTSLPNITGLHLSGNELTGPGFPPKLEAWPSTLRSLVLSHNRLSSSIPLSLQRSMTQLELLDVSFNRIDGQLSSVSLSPNHTSFSAEVNRFSGLLSSSIIAAPRGSVSVLEGSLIDCSDRQAQLPVNDPYISHFKCGSLTFNVFLYTFAALVAFTLSLLVGQSRFSWGTMLAWAFPATDVQAQKDSKASLLCQQLKFLELERWFCLSLLAVLVAVLLPAYGALSATQGTHTFLYAWAVSAAFKGGIASAATLLVLWSALLTFSDYHFSRTRRALIEVDSKQQQVEDSRLPSVSGLRNSKSSARAWLLLRLILIFSVNFVVITPANIGYVFVVASYANSVQTTAAIMLTAFKQFWNKFVLSDALRNPALFFGVTADEIAVFKLEPMLGGFAFELFLVALNSVVIPALALLTADSNCFRTALYAPDPVVSSYRSEVCKMLTVHSIQDGSMSLDLVCDKVVHKSISYQPAFIYGYQCSASLLQTYAPIFLLVALYSFAGEPLLHWCVRTALSRWPWLKTFHLLRLIPRIMHLPSERRIEEQGRKKARRTAAGHRFYRILDARAIYMSLLQDLMLLFTFGVVAPLLGLVLLSAIVLKSLRWHHLIVAFANSDEEKQGGGVDALLADLSDFSQTQHPFFKARWFILGYASLFLSFFLIDTAGDAQGWKRAMWAPALMWVLPALLSLALQVFLPPRAEKEEAAPAPAKSNVSEEAVWRGSLELQTFEAETREGSLSDGRLSASAPASGRATVAAAHELGWITANPLQSPRRSGNANPQQHVSLDTVKATPRLRSLDEPRNSSANTATL